MILLELGMDTDTICAGMLHDVVEDTDMTLDDVRKQFGQDVATLVDGVTKISKIPSSTADEQVAENTRKIIIATAQDIRVIIIKLADRLHNMRTLQHRKPAGQRRTSRETMNIFAPIAHRLGIYPIQNELEELSLKYLDPFAYQQTIDLMELDSVEGLKFIENTKQAILDEFSHYSEYPFLANAHIEGRVKSIYGMYKKMFLHAKSFNSIYDKYALRIILDDKSQCYVALGIIHDMFTPVPDRFKDYISNPKDNMYRSIHTTVVGKDGIPFEVQIRTWEMHRDAEYGIAAHWKYKEGISIENVKYDERVNWFRSIIEAQQASDDVENIVELIKNDDSKGEMLVMTPKGDPINMPFKSTVIDFAYRIHTQVGHTAMGAKVNGIMVPLNHEIKTGDIVDIVTSKDPKKGPNRAWLNIATTSEAKSKIRSWFKKEKREENILQGRDILEREFKRNRMRIPEDELEGFLSECFKKYSCKTLEDFYASIGYGGVQVSKIMPRLKTNYDKKYGTNEPETQESLNLKTTKSNNSHGIVFENGLDNCEIKLSQCCNPVPYDEIVGFITRGKGAVSIHKTTCPNYQSAVRKSHELERWIKASWIKEANPDYFQVTIEVIATDRIGLVFDLTSVLAESRIMIRHSASGMLKNGNATFKANIYIANLTQLRTLCDRLKKVDGVISVNRV
jgi:GTP pyrophosphokinase